MPGATLEFSMVMYTLLTKRWRLSLVDPSRCLPALLDVIMALETKRDRIIS